MQIARGLKGTWNVVEISVADFLLQQQSMWGHPSYDTFEVLQHGMWVRPFFDLDDDNVPAEGRDAYARECFERAKHSLCIMFEQASEGCFSFDDQVIVGHRHGWVPAKQRFKVSWRFWVVGFRILMEHLPNMIRTFEQDASGLWDLSIYSSKRKMGVPGGCKGGGDTRVLELQDRSHSEAAIIQNLADGDGVLDYPSMCSAANTSRHSSTVSTYHQAPTHGITIDDASWDRVTEVLHQHGFANPRYRGRREQSFTFQCDCLGGECACCHLVHDSNSWWVMDNGDGTFGVKNYSPRCQVRTIGTMTTVAISDGTPASRLSCHIKNMGFTEDVQECEDHSGGMCQMVKQHLEHCPTCSASHADPCYLVRTIVQDCYSMRNVEPTCRERLVSLEQGATNKAFQAMSANPKSELAMARLYIQHQDGALVSDEHHIYRFDGALWVPLTDIQAQKHIQGWLDSTLDKLLELACHEEHMLGYRKSKEQTRLLTKMKDTVNRARGHVQFDSTVHKLFNTVKREVNEDKLADKMDADPYLLATDSGVVDLRTCIFRPATKDDRISMSTGYDWLESPDRDVQTQVLNFIEAVYPMEDERELMQRWCGYCLLGLANEKLFLLLTDSRDGFNGKSSFLRLLASTMGAYAAKPDPAILYKEDRPRGANDHSAAIMALRKTRAAYVEETDPTRVLAEEVLKDWTGGGTRITGRACHATDVVEFEFITKLTVAFNQGKCPHFNTEDSALVQRILTIPHRSRFYLEDVPDEPFSFPADPNLKQHFKVWRPYFLRWCLEGLQHYHAKGFRDIPPSCQSFKNDLVAEKNVVSEFLNEAVETCDFCNFVHVKDLYNDFDEAYRTLQKDKKTKKSLQLFKAGVMKSMPTAYRERLQYKTSTGSTTSARSVLVGYKRRQKA